ncbi:MAG: hypothetical protein OXE42_01275 [Gammaproteobacteria bacterium]|nr:hypothetical protein [Gammaproteobacteria bacterium]
MTSQADRIRASMENQVNDLMADVASEFFEEVVETTPVQSGRLRQGWRMKRGAVNTSIPKLRKGKYRKPRTPKIAPPTPGADNAIYVSNGVPYIVEANSGNADRAPTRFIQAALARVLAKFQ